MRNRKPYFIVWIIFVIMVISPKIVYAEQFTNEQSGIDIIFVMDYSGSMKTNDPQNMAKGMVKAFIDTAPSERTRIGFVSYNDQILSSISPISIKTQEQRDKLKYFIDAKSYSGNTDIGLGLKFAYDIMEQETERKKIIVLISDGETVLKGSKTGRDVEISEKDRIDTIEKCKKDEIQIYTIAFGKYDGSIETLQSMSEETNATMYTAETSEKLIEILYGILATNVDYNIQKITDAVYGEGTQNIRIKLEEQYLDELDVFIISFKEIGEVSVLYGEQRIEAINLKNYAIGKIEDIKRDISELTVQIETSKNEKIEIYLISYRSIIPVFEVNTEGYRNSPIQYKLYFKDNNGTVIKDEKFYQDFLWEFFGTDSIVEQDMLSSNEKRAEILDATIVDGIIFGESFIQHSGNYYVGAKLEDSMGSREFEPVKVTISNRAPEGKLPQLGRCTILTKERSFILEEYFLDADGDILSYSLENGIENCVKATIVDGVLTLKPIKDGIQTLKLVVSDGEAVVMYEGLLEVTPLWEVYWWAIMLVIVIIVGIIFWKLTHRAVPEIECIEKETKNNQFVGKLDAYFTIQPEEDKEIPPLSFLMYKIKSNKIILGNLLNEYKEACASLGLNEIYFMADEEKRMILYHSSSASIMIGNSIACKQIQYSVSFGDVIYITSQDGDYELELHYIAVIQ